MKELYTNYLNKFTTAKTIAEKYKLSTEKADKALTEIPNFKVTVPLVGGFSTGKSSLINTALGRELLSTEITPETAVPAEISYGTDSVVYVSKNGTSKGTVDELNTKKLSIENVRLVQVSLDDNFLKTIPTVKIVDMPGFDSGFELHNRAIDEYLPKSLAYVICVSADEGTVRESVLNFLGELKLNKMPVYLVITKSDKVMPDELDEVVKHIKTTVENRLEIANITVAVTSADDDESEEFKNILTEIENRSDEVFKKHFRGLLVSFLADIKNYLVSTLKLRDTSSEKIKDEIETLEKNIADLQKDIMKEKDNFDKQCEQVIGIIKNKVISDLRASSSMLENMIYQGSDVSDKVNTIVRNSITAEIHRSFEPRIKRYSENISAAVARNMIIPDTSSPLIDPNVKAENEEIREIAESLITPVSTVAATVLGEVLAGSTIAAALGLTATVLAPIGAVVGLALGHFVKKGLREKEESQKRDAARSRVNQLINSVSETIGTTVQTAIFGIRDDINDSIDKEIEEKINIQKKALDDANDRLRLNEQEKNAETLSLTVDLQTVERMIKEEGDI